MRAAGTPDARAAAWAQILCALWAKAPIIALTAYTLGGDTGQFLDAGMNARLDKPLEREQLYRVIREVTSTA